MEVNIGQYGGARCDVRRSRSIVFKLYTGQYHISDNLHTLGDFGLTKGTENIQVYSQG